MMLSFTKIEKFCKFMLLKRIKVTYRILYWQAHIFGKNGVLLQGQSLNAAVEQLFWSFFFSEK